MNQRDTIQRLWEELECPDFHGILYADGRITNESGKALSELDLSESTILAVLSRVEKPGTNYEIICGESASHGSDGFVAFIEKGTNKLIWLYYSNESNPFCHIELSSNNIKVTSTSGKIAKFSLEKTGVKVELT